jgi:hypothetical protein
LCLLCLSTELLGEPSLVAGVLCCGRKRALEFVRARLGPLGALGRLRHLDLQALDARSALVAQFLDLGRQIGSLPLGSLLRSLERSFCGPSRLDGNGALALQLLRASGVLALALRQPLSQPIGLLAMGYGLGPCLVDRGLKSRGSVE